MNKKKLRLFAACTLILLFILAVSAYFKNRTAVNTVKLMEGTLVETSYQIIEGRNPGKTVFVIGGTHGDETSGWKAAAQLKEAKAPDAGTLIILSPANAPGTGENHRNVEQYRDLNRSFPGEKDRDLTDKLAASIYQAIADTSPDIVVDLHEAYREEGNRDFLGNSIILTTSDGMEELVYAIIDETRTGVLCTKPFSYYGPAPAGSLNREVTERLHIPVITIEASQEDPIEERIQNHLALVNRILNFPPKAEAK